MNKQKLIKIDNGGFDLTEKEALEIANDYLKKGKDEELKEWLNAGDEFSYKEFYDFVEDKRKQVGELK